MSFQIELGHLPDRDLSPNRRLHYMQLYRAKEDAKDQQSISDAFSILDKELGPEALEAIKKIIASNVPKQDLSGVEERLDDVDKRMDGLDDNVGRLSESDCQVEMTRLCSDWQTINGSQEFKDWLKNVDDVTGYSYFDLLSLAYNDKDPIKSVAIFKRYKATLPETPTVDLKEDPKIKKLDELTAPDKGSSSDSLTKTEPKIYSRAEVNQFYNDFARGKYKGKERAAMAAKINADIDLAAKEGRIAA